MFVVECLAVLRIVFGVLHALCVCGGFGFSECLARVVLTRLSRPQGRRTVLQFVCLARTVVTWLSGPHGCAYVFRLIFMKALHVFRVLRAL